MLIEAGHRLAGGFLRAGLIDELVVYMAPKLIGNSEYGLVSMDSLSMQDIVNLQLMDTRQVGNDIRFNYKVDRTTRS